MNRKLHILERTQFLPAAPEEVFSFFSDASNLEAITPAFLRFRIRSPMPVVMGVGARIEYGLSLFGVPFRWRTRITRWEPGACFVDEQESGPYSFWRHTHSFEAGPGTTTMRDRVEYSMPLGPVGRAIRALFVARALERIFDYRRDAIGAIFGGPHPGSTGAQSRMEESPAVIAFRQGAARWFDVGDPIMGGVSSSEMEIDGGIGVFRGTVSLEKGGGFASVRSEEGRYDLSGFDGILLRVRGDGKRYGMRLRTSSNFDGVSFQAVFQPRAGAWSDVRLPFPEFRPVFRGRPVPEYPPFDPADVRTFGLIIAGRQEGPFRLELLSIGGYRERESRPAKAAAGGG